MFRDVLCQWLYGFDDRFFELWCVWKCVRRESCVFVDRMCGQLSEYAVELP